MEKEESNKQDENLENQSSEDNADKDHALNTESETADEKKNNHF